MIKQMGLIVVFIAVALVGVLVIAAAMPQRHDMDRGIMP